MHDELWDLLESDKLFGHISQLLGLFFVEAGLTSILPLALHNRPLFCPVGLTRFNPTHIAHT